MGAGVVAWLWSVALILSKVPKGELITGGPYALVKHPLYTGVSLLVLPWVGFLLNSWLGALVGVAIYIASRLYAPAEETKLSTVFGESWDKYQKSVAIPWPGGRPAGPRRRASSFLEAVRVGRLDQGL